MDEISRLLIQYILEATDPLIQIAFINTLKTLEQTYPSNSTIHINELLDLGKQTSRSSFYLPFIDLFFIYRIYQSSRCFIKLFFHLTSLDIR